MPQDEVIKKFYEKAQRFLYTTIVEYEKQLFDNLVEKFLIEENKTYDIWSIYSDFNEILGTDNELVAYVAEELEQIDNPNDEGDLPLDIFYEYELCATLENLADEIGYNFARGTFLKSFIELELQVVEVTSLEDDECEAKVIVKDIKLKSFKDDEVNNGKMD